MPPVPSSPRECGSFPIHPLGPAARAFFGKKMEIYAGMVENLDYHVGGSSTTSNRSASTKTPSSSSSRQRRRRERPPRHDRGRARHPRLPLRVGPLSQTNPNAWGDPAPGSPTAMWAQVSMTPSASTRHGSRRAASGTRSSSAGPGSAAQGEHRPPGVMHVADIMPTLLEWPARAIRRPTRGKTCLRSWQVLGPVLAGQAESPRTDQDVLAWRSSATAPSGRGTGSCAGVEAPRQGDWELFDLSTDPGELKDLAADRPTSSGR